MAPPFALPPSASPPGHGFLGRARAFLLERWPGRILLGAIFLALVGEVGLRIPVLTGAARVLLWVFGLWALLRLSSLALRRLLWRIRSKLILSYLFIALVPVVLLTLFFGIASVLLLNLVGAHLVTAEIESMGHTLEAEARTSLAGLPATDPAPALKERLKPVRARHPGLGFSLVEGGRAVMSAGGAPESLPGWWKGPGFTALVKKDDSERLRAGWTEGKRTLLLDVPVDGPLFADLERRMGIHLLTVGGRVSRIADTKGISIEFDDQTSLPSLGGEERRKGFAFVATPERVDWETGERELDALSFQFQPWDLLRRLQPGSLNMADMLVVALTAVGGVFLVMYAVALLLGLFLARSITRSVHSLSVGTQRLRQGDFGQTIAVTSRDQLGELAESFNLMSRGIEDLLREQAEKERLEEELRIARQIQMSLLPAQGSVTAARPAGGRALPSRGGGGRRLLRPAPALRHTHGRARGRRLRQGNVGRSLHGGAEGPGALAVEDLRIAGAPAHRSEPDPLREHGRAVLHHHDLRGRGHGPEDHALCPGRPQPDHPLRGRNGHDSRPRPPRASAWASTAGSASRRSSRKRRCLSRAATSSSSSRTGSPRP